MSESRRPGYIRLKTNYSGTIKFVELLKLLLKGIVYKKKHRKKKIIISNFEKAHFLRKKIQF